MPITELPGRAWLIDGKRFQDDRGESHEVFDLSTLSALPDTFVPVQENLIETHEAGVLRGLHFQAPPHAQAKLVTVLRGAAQFFWVPLRDLRPIQRTAFSTILRPDGSQLYTPGDLAHGVLTLEPGTVFSLKMSHPVNHQARHGLLFETDIRCDYAIPPRFDLMSERDRLPQA